MHIPNIIYSMAVNDVAVTIVGAGPSGLATAAYLTHLSIPYTILERDDCFAPLWLKYAYDRLHLHIPKYSCDLPLLPMPANYPLYPSRDQFTAYLNDYVSHFGITPKLRRSVFAAEYDGGNWKVKAKNLVTGDVEEHRSRFLVVASGENSDPVVPDIEGLGSFAGEVVHSTAYRNGKRFSGKSVLVVGSGNSGMEIALDLSEAGATVAIVVRSPVHVLSRPIVQAAMALLSQLSLTSLDSIVTTLSKIVYGDLSRYGIHRPKEGPYAMKLNYGKYPIVDVGTIDKIKSGQIKVLPPIEIINGNNVLFKNKEEYIFDAIIFATGFKTSTKAWLKGGECLLDENGMSKPDLATNWKGQNGLYCVGLARKGFYGAASDAENVAQDIKAQL